MIVRIYIPRRVEGCDPPWARRALAEICVRMKKLERCRCLMRRTVCIILFVSLLACASRRAPAQDEAPDAVVIRGATVFTATERGTIEGGDVILRKGRIARVDGPDRRPFPSGAGVLEIDGVGKFVTPGLIDAWSMMALNPGGRPDAGATLRAADAIDIFDMQHFTDAWRGGVTTVCIEPPGASGIVGVAAVVRLHPADRLAAGMVEESALVARIGIGTAGPIARLGEIKVLREAFEQAAAYREAWDEYREKLEEYEKKLKAGETVKLKEEKIGRAHV